MLSVFLDTNILLDVSLERAPWFAAARSIIEEGSKRERMKCLVSPLSLKDVYFITARQKNEHIARGFVQLLCEACEVVNVGAATCALSLAGSEPDFEDGLIAASVQECDADIVITRDARAFAQIDAVKVDPLTFADFFFAPNSYPREAHEVWASVRC